MTINELEQGIRNLIASQPMAMAGPNGDVINGINSLIDAFRNLSFRVQSYPCQDVMKFGLSSEAAKLENTLSSLACQVLQERGINIMLYVPHINAGYPAGVNGYGVISPQLDQNMMMGQMMYTANPAQMGGMMPQMPNMARPPMYNQMQPQMMATPQPVMPSRTRQTASSIPSYVPAVEPVKLEPAEQTEQSVKPRVAHAAPKKEVLPKPQKVAPTPKKEAEPVEEVVQEKATPSAKPSPAAMLMGEADPQQSNAKGRDYLLELLKK